MHLFVVSLYICDLFHVDISQYIHTYYIYMYFCTECSVWIIRVNYEYEKAQNCFITETTARCIPETSKLKRNGITYPNGITPILIRNLRQPLTAVIAAIYKRAPDQRSKFGTLNRVIWPIFPYICKWPQPRSRDRCYHRSRG